MVNSFKSLSSKLASYLLPFCIFLSVKVARSFRDLKCLMYAFNYLQVKELYLRTLLDKSLRQMLGFTPLLNPFYQAQAGFQFFYEKVQKQQSKKSCLDLNCLNMNLNLLSHKQCLRFRNSLTTMVTISVGMSTLVFIAIYRAQRSKRNSTIHSFVFPSVEVSQDQNLTNF